MLVVILFAEFFVFFYIWTKLSLFKKKKQQKNRIGEQH